MPVKSNIQLNSNEFSDGLNKFNNKRQEIAEQLAKISLSMNKIDGYNKIWNSDTQKIVHEDFKEIEKRFGDINAEFKKYSDFLKGVLEKHNIEEKTQTAFINENDTNLDVN